MRRTREYVPGTTSGRQGRTRIFQPWSEWHGPVKTVCPVPEYLQELVWGCGYWGVAVTHRVKRRTAAKGYHTMSIGKLNVKLDKQGSEQGASRPNSLLSGIPPAPDGVSLRKWEAYWETERAWAKARPLQTVQVTKDD